MDSKPTKFRVFKIEDVRKDGSVLVIGGEYIGSLSGNQILWTDPGSDQDWSFYINDTCEIIP